jgi:hypothetical protein
MIARWLAEGQPAETRRYHGCLCSPHSVVGRPRFDSPAVVRITELAPLYYKDRTPNSVPSVRKGDRPLLCRVYPRRISSRRVLSKMTGRTPGKSHRWPDPAMEYTTGLFCIHFARGTIPMSDRVCDFESSASCALTKFGLPVNSDS